MVKNLLVPIFFFLFSFAVNAQCEHVSDSIDVEKVEVFAFDLSAKLVTKKKLVYDDGINPKNDLCLSAGIYIIVIPKKKKSYKIGLLD